jgi:hypothetical protein
VGSSAALSSSESVGMARSIFFFYSFLFDYRIYGFSFLNSSYVLSIAFILEKVLLIAFYFLWAQQAVQGLIADMASLISAVTFSISEGLETTDYLHVS